MSIFEIDVQNMRKIMSARDKIFIIREMVQNAWDEDITRVDILLTPPDENGHSTLRVTDDSPTGWISLQHAYTMYAESSKANDPTKRGRFNEGEKAVICLAIEASVTTMNGQVCFDQHHRWMGDKKRKRGSEFFMKFELTEKEYFDVCRKSRLLIPPRDITTVFNGVEIPKQAPFQMFDARLRTPINGRNEPRKAEVRLYDVRPGEAWLYEMGIPVVELREYSNGSKPREKATEARTGLVVFYPQSKKQSNDPNSDSNVQGAPRRSASPTSDELKGLKRELSQATVKREAAQEEMDASLAGDHDYDRYEAGSRMVN
jgi:hypothetical protein